ncbi:coiled-coil domain-containing protein [Helicobacter bizzozeronii]|uniref:hypothetical protein n=1 Tax=Helicobacter bizzozeronii TaxID=56877 RepID=UPI0018F85BD3|nr:hypothetical protein [Helicobacter bizzozeronii]
MGNTSSINFKQTKNKVQTQHNDRSKEPSYLLPQEDVEKVGGGVEVNRSADQAEALKNAIVKKAILDYKEYRGQKFQAKSYLWSAVVNIKPDTTMQDLERLATHFKTKYGFQCYQIAIHRDEGHKDEEGNIRLNHHAHLEFVTLDENTGKSLFRKQYITNKTLRDIQTETADILGMQRGEDAKKSGRKRIEPRAYAKLMNETRQKHNTEKQELKAEKDKALKKLNQAINICCAFLDSGLIVEQDKKGLEPLTPDNTESNLIEMSKRAVRRYADREATLTQEKQELETSNAALNTQLNELKGQHAKELEAKDTEHSKAVANLKQEHSKELDKTKQEITTLKTANANLETAHAQAVKDLKDQHAQDVEKLKQEHSTKEAQLTQERDKAISQLDSATKTAQELTDAKTKTETALADLQTAHKVLEAKYSALETSQTDNTQKLEDLKQKHTKELEELNTAHAQAVKDLNTASAQKDKQITRLEAQTAQQQKTITQLEQAIRQVKGLIVQKFDTAVAEVTKGLKAQSAAVVSQKHEYEMATAELNAKLDILIERARKDKKLANALKGVFNKMGFNKSLDDPGYFEPTLIDRQKQEIRSTSAQALKAPLEEVSKENAGHVSRLKSAFSSLTSAVEKVAQVVKDSQEYGKQLTAEQKKNEDLTRENNRLKEDLAQEQNQNKGARDYIIELNDKVADLTHKVKELQEQTKDDTPTPSKSKDTPKPTEPQKSPQPTESTTPKKPLGM